MTFKDKAKGRAYLNEWKRERTKRIHPLLRKRMRIEEFEEFARQRDEKIAAWTSPPEAAPPTAGWCHHPASQWNPRQQRGQRVGGGDPARPLSPGVAPVDGAMALTEAERYGRAIHVRAP